MLKYITKGYRKQTIPPSCCYVDRNRLTIVKLSVNTTKFNIMKKLFLTGISLLFAVTLTFAQNTDVQQDARKKAAELTEKLQLTAEQQGSIHQIILEGLQQKETLKANNTISEDAKKETLKAGAKDKDAKIKAVLTEEQKAKYEDWVKKNKEEHKKDHKDHKENKKH